MRRSCLAAVLPFALIACNGEAGQVASNTNGTAATAPARPTDGKPFTATPVAEFDEPWAMAFLPDGRLLVTEKRGALKLWSANGAAIDVSGVPSVDYGGQGGFGDVVLHPDFASNNIVYLSWVEAGDGDTRGAVVGRARLNAGDGAASLEDMEIIWRQAPKVTGRGHYAHRIAFGPDGKMYVSSGDRQKFDPAQDMNANLGKILRLNDDGTPAAGNPWADRGGVTAQIWSLGQRNPLGIAFAADGSLWEHEMGPRGGDEFNRIERGSNYGYPIVSDGDHYDGRDIPDHSTRPELNAPEIVWTPVISPAGMIFYSGSMFPAWRGSALLGGLSGETLVRVTIDGTTARVADRWDMDARIREVEQGPDGAVWVLEDEDDGSGGRLLKLTPTG